MAPALPAWELGTPLSMVLYTSTSPTGQDIDPLHPLVQWDGLTYGNWNDEREADLVLDVPESVLHNGSWWLDIVLVKDGGLPLNKQPGTVYSQRKCESLVWEENTRGIMKNLQKLTQNQQC